VKIIAKLVRRNMPLFALAALGALFLFSFAAGYVTTG
jgi:hypothetical protein